MWHDWALVTAHSLDHHHWHRPAGPPPGFFAPTTRPLLWVQARRALLSGHTCARAAAEPWTGLHGFWDIWYQHVHDCWGAEHGRERGGQWYDGQVGLQNGIYLHLHVGKLIFYLALKKYVYVYVYEEGRCSNFTNCNILIYSIFCHPQT